MTKRWKDGLVIVGAGVLLRAFVAFAWLRAMPLVSDAADYASVARGFVASFPGDAAYYWPPGNPLVYAGVYAVFGDGIGVTHAVTLALSAAAIPLVMLLAREVDPRSERVSGWLAALYFPAVLLSGQSYAQHLAAIALLGVAYFGLRALRDGKLALFAAAGLALGVGCITRPSMASLAPVFAIAWVLANRANRVSLARLALGGALAVAVAGAIVLPVVRHNLTHGGGATISTNNERNFFLGNNPYTPSYKTSHLGQRSLDELDPETRGYLESFTTREAMQHEAVSYMEHHPGITAYRTLNRATSFWGFDYLASRIIQEDRGWGKRGLLPLLALEAGSYALTMLLAIIGAFAFNRARAGSAAKDGVDAAAPDPYFRRWLLWLAMAYELPYMLAFSGGTYHFPVIGLLVPFAGFAALRAREIGAHLRKSRVTVSLVVVFIAIQAEYAYYSIVMSS